MLADNEFADGSVVSAVFAEMAEPVCKPAIGAKQAKAVVRGVGHVTCNAHEQQGVAVRAPETVDADVVAASIDAIGVAGDGCSFAWQGWDPVGVLASAGSATPIDLWIASALELANVELHMLVICR